MALWLARASSQLARRAARGRFVHHQPRHGDPRPWFLGSAPPILGSPAPNTAAAAGGHRGFCSVRHFAGESSAAAAAVNEEELPDNCSTNDGDQVHGL
jgi:2-oxoisovalerate dehydrogenase E1 component alpha subunit